MTLYYGINEGNDIILFYGGSCIEEFKKVKCEKEGFDEFSTKILGNMSGTQRLLTVDA
jgi:hypothetical protein